VLFRSPGDEALRAALGQATGALRAAFEEHLEAEERAIFPAVRALPAPVQAQILVELRARRG
jgi:hypothetical protein